MATIYLNGYQTSAKLQKNAVLITKYCNGEKRKQIKVPLLNVDRVVVAGKANFSTSLLHRFCDKGIPVHLLSSRGTWLGAFYPGTDNYSQRRLAQYEAVRNTEGALCLARALVEAKLRNSRRVLQRLAARRGESQNEEYQHVARTLSGLMENLFQAESLDHLRGYEGYGSALYFHQLGKYFSQEMSFDGRNRRPPRDPVNAILSFGYSMLLAEIDTAIRIAGLDPCLGFLHDFRYGRPSLALDLLEPLRAPFCDMLTLHLCNHRLLRAEEHFEVHGSEGVHLNAEGRQIFFEEYERSMHRETSYPDGRKNTRDVVEQMVGQIVSALEGAPVPQFYRMP